MWGAKKIPEMISPGEMWQIMVAMFSSQIAAAAFLLWWVFASRISWKEKFLVLGGCFAIAACAVYSYDKSMSGMGGMMIMFYVLPPLITIWVLWLLCTLVTRWPIRRYGLFVVFALVWGYFALVRLDGVTGAFQSTMNYRWVPTSEELFEKQAKTSSKPQLSATENSAEEIQLEPEDWPGFRGPNRDGVRTGVQLDLDWTAHPPRELWRKRVGPGWSSFAVVGHRAYTQEQRGKNEVVVCYDANTGDELWVHSDTARFEEALAGPGPRATPTFGDGKIYSLGASGILNCLDAATGNRLWFKDVKEDANAKEVPDWGYSSSPQVAAGIVSVYANVKQGTTVPGCVLGYDAATGELKWSIEKGQFSYCSTQLSRLEGVEQLLISTEKGVSAFDQSSGEDLWQFDWDLPGMARVVQPAVIGNTDVLIGTGFGIGTKRFHVSREDGTWKTKEVWTNTLFSPYFNDFVVHQNHLYGFDKNFFVCVNLDDGKTKWKARGYGSGEVLLLADQSVLLVLAETGEVALLSASPEGHSVLGKIEAIKGKTWNHPVVAQGKLFVRNGDEAACYELAQLTIDKSETQSKVEEE
jgi:outer membrane protein assembly factor BamB